MTLRYNSELVAEGAKKDGNGDVISSTYAKNVDLSTVATSGSYNDLSNKPTIPEEQIFNVTYGTTTYAEIDTALNNGKLPVCYYNYKKYIYSIKSNTVHYFTAVYSPYLYIVRCHQNSPYWSSLTNVIQATSDKVTSINSSSTDTQYPSAKCVYDELVTKQDILVSSSNIKTINGDSILGSGDLSISSGASRNIGEIVQSTIPLTDAGLHLLDGALLDACGGYGAFVDYIADLYDSGNYTAIFETEANWQTSVTNYGVCGKFVYDSVNGTVRLPKITGFIEGASGTATLGDLTEAGLPNITGTVNSDYSSNFSGAFYFVRDVSGNGGSGNDQVAGFDASRCSAIYGNSNTVQPQSVKALYYIVVATTTKTEIEVDIDQIATDLNGKADTDLSNVPTSKGILTESYVNGTSWYRIYSDGWCEQGGVATNTANVSFLKNFIDTNYTALVCWQTISTGSAQSLLIYSKSTSSMTIRFKWSSDNSTSNVTVGSYNWQASGYIS